MEGHGLHIQFKTSTDSAINTQPPKMEYDKQTLRKLIGDMGTALGFEVILNEDEKNNFDCMWKSPTGFCVIIKMVLSADQSEDPDKLCNCIWNLTNEGKIPGQGSAIGLYIVRNNTTKSELINSIITKNQTHQLRVITFDELWDSVDFFYPIYYRNENLRWSAPSDTQKESADMILVVLGLKVTPDAGVFIKIRKHKQKVECLERLYNISKSL